MSKNLKDIFDAGMKRLDELTARRKELHARCQERKQNARLRIEASNKQLAEIEPPLHEEIVALAKRSHDQHRQTMAQILEDNERHLGDVKEEIELLTSRLLSELQYMQEWSLEGAAEKIDAATRPIMRDYDAAVLDVTIAGSAGLNELEAAAKHAQSGMLESRDKLMVRLSGSAHDSQRKLSTIFTELRKELEGMRPKLKKEAEAAQKKVAAHIQETSDTVEKQFSDLLEEHQKSVKDLAENIATELAASHKEIINEAETRITELSQESLSELETTCEFNSSEMANTLEQLKTQSNDLVTEIRHGLKKIEAKVRAEGESKTKESLHAISDATESKVENEAADASKKMVDELEKDMHKLSADLTKQLSGSLKMHIDRLVTLMASAEGSLGTSAESLRFDLDRLYEHQNSTFKQKEEELAKRLAVLETQALKILEQTPDLSRALGGEKE